MTNPNPVAPKGLPRCCVCGVSVMQAKEAFTRINPKGEVPAVWACYSHTDKAKPEIIRIIEEATK